MVGVRIGGWQMVVAQQLRQMIAAGLCTGTIHPHDHTRNDLWRLHGLGRTRMHFVVQGLSLGVVDHWGLSNKIHSSININDASKRPNEKRHPKVPFEA
jgi:signal transduction protein with GAF and PtsI domain